MQRSKSVASNDALSRFWAPQTDRWFKSVPIATKTGKADARASAFCFGCGVCVRKDTTSF
ncbi:MAG: hypothetical protein IJ300_00135 [Clostridia bacterium]|nr:hypothetical protein [Clostridia bacterium]